MIGSVAAESEILTTILSLKDDPLKFIHYVIPWGVSGTPFADLKGPRRWQSEELEAIGEHTRAQRFALENGLPAKVYKSAISSGRGPGKSALFGMLALWHASTRIGAPTIVSANTEGQLRSRTFPEYATWFGSSLNSHWWSLETMRIVPAPWLVEVVKRLPQDGGLGVDPRYWAVIGQTWSLDNPHAFAGAHNPYGMLLQFDEASGIPGKIFEVAEGFFTQINPYRYWVCASQTRNREGRFFDLFNDAQMGAGWRLKTLSTRGMEGIDQSVIEDQIKRYGADSDFVRVEIDGLAPRTSEDQFIPWSHVQTSQQNNLFRDEGEPLILGVDPAPRGKTAWRFRQGRNARDCCGPATRGEILCNTDSPGNTIIAKKVLELDQKYRPDAICIDFGMGSGVIDYIRRKRTHGRLHEVKFGDSAHSGKDSEWGSHAAELWATMRDWLPGGMIEKDSGEKGTLSKQLTDRGWRYSQREDGKKILETKEDMRSRGTPSPDDADALACTFEVNPPRLDQMKARRQIIADGVDDGPF